MQLDPIILTPADYAILTKPEPWTRPHKHARVKRCSKLPFTYMWTPPRVRAKLNAAFAARKPSERVQPGAPTRAWRRDFIRGELRRLRPVVAAQHQSRLRFKQLWRLSLTAET